MGQAEQKTYVAANIAWALDTVLRGAEFVPQSQTLAVLPILAKLLQVPHPEATAYSAKAIERLAKKHDETIIQRVLDIDELSKSLINLLWYVSKLTIVGQISYQQIIFDDHYQIGLIPILISL